jgi:hypothetical protein
MPMTVVDTFLSTDDSLNNKIPFQLSHGMGLKHIILLLLLANGGFILSKTHSQNLLILLETFNYRFTSLIFSVNNTKDNEVYNSPLDNSNH